MKKTPRIYYLDFIRAIAMIAGIFFHSALSFLKIPEKDWPIFDDQASSGLIDLFSWASHRVRMPIFFIVCGFFTYMLLQKYDLKDFIKNRTKRILVPFLLSMVIIVPISVDTFITDGNFAPYSNSRIEYYSLMHLWFLYFLLIYYALTFILKSPLTKFISTQSKKKELGFCLIILILIAFMKKTTSINASLYFIADPVSLSFYFTFYLFGFYIYKHPNVLTKYYNKKMVLIFIISLILTPMILLLKNARLEYATILLTALYTISAIIILIEYTKKVFNKNSKLIRYICDSSYWLYLMHIPVVVTIQVFIIKNTNTTKEMKFILTSMLSLFVLLLSYQFFVRYTVIGTFLHGKRIRDEDLKKSLA